MLLSLLIALSAPGHCPAGCAPNPRPHVGRNVGAILAPDPLSLIEVPYNYAWTTPYAGWTLYPGQSGSGYGTTSDYSHMNWVVSPEQNAGIVRGRLTQMGIPAVPPEPLFLGKNPSVTDDIKLPVPRPRIKEPPEKDLDKDKGKDL